MSKKFEIRGSDMGAFAYIRNPKKGVHEYDMFEAGIDLMLAEGHDWDWDTIEAMFNLVVRGKKQNAT